MTLTSLADFSVFAAREYLQSAVFIDDNIYTPDTARPASASEIAVRELKPAFVEVQEADATAAPEAEQPLPERPPFRTKDLVGSFAQFGIVCALYEPEPDFPTNEDSVVFKLCETADLVILDWDFHEVGVVGTKPKALIESLIKSGNRVAPHHIRLIAIYTNTIDLQVISNSIYEHLKGRGCDPEPIGDSAFRLRSGSSRILVLGKDGVRRAADQTNFSVKESDLANRLLQEFSDMNSGILPSYALHGMGAIRRNSKRILDRFHRGMDGAFLLHRELVAHDHEAFHQLTELLADELRAVVEDEHLNATQIALIATSALKGNDISAQDTEAIEYAKTGAKSSKVVHKKLLVDKASVPVGHQRLAALFSSRTQYSKDFRTLTYGTVVRRRLTADSPWTFAFCLIPICDSLRLDVGKKISFPFWTLLEDLYSGTTKRRGMVLYLPDEKSISLTAGGKASEMLWLGEFSVDATTQTVRATLKDGVFRFLGDASEIQWIGQLKPLHAQRIAIDIGDHLSRVGLDEAEWLRLLCDG
jgi:response regulator receiver domain-containing protein